MATNDILLLQENSSSDFIHRAITVSAQNQAIITNGSLLPEARALTVSDITDLQATLDLKAPLASPTFTGTITGTLSGNSTTATALQTPRTINGESFDGSANINIEGRYATTIPSATTTTIGTKGIGETVQISGTTTITSLGVSQTGTVRKVVFLGALILTYNATSLTLPTSANITTVANDTAIFVCENGALGYWRCINYTRRSGQSLGSAPSLTTARTISGVSFNGTANINIEDRVGTPIASATTTTVGTSGLGDYIHITGTTTINSFGTASTAGIRRTLIFDSGLTVTHNATSLICPGATNLVAVAGTIIEIVAETTANWRIVAVTHPSQTLAQMGYVVGVTSAIQTQIDGKQATITGGATTIATTDLTVSRALVSDGSGKVAVATTTSTEIGYVNGVTSAIQTQLDGKQNIALSIGTGTSVALDFTTNKLQEQSISANATLTVTGLAVGETGIALINNSHATNTVTITNPTASSFVLQRGLLHATLLAGEYVEIEITRYTNFHVIRYGEALLKNA